MSKSGQQNETHAWFRSDWIWALLLPVAVLLAYQQVWHAGFIWDDDSHITQNPCIVGPLGFKDIWTTSAATYYPLVLTAFWIQHAIWGLNPLPYHLVNVAVHGICAILLWLVLRRLNVRGAWFGAALWALHPVQVESVAWITELKNTQSCLFYLLAILFFLKWIGMPGQGRAKYYALVLICSALAILSKSSTVMLPCVLALCWWWMDRRWRWRNILALAPFVLVAAIASAWTIWEQKFHSGALGPEWAQSRAERAILAGKAVWFYFGKLAWPHPLIFIYPRWNIDASSLTACLPSLALLFCIYFLWRGRNGRTRPLFFAMAYFVISLFPVLGFFNVYFFRYSFVGDHFQYLASMGPLALAGASCAMFFNSMASQKPWLQIAFSGILLLGLGGMTWRQCGMYRDVETLWEITLARNPECWMAQNNIGNALLQQGRIQEAIARFNKSLKLDPAAMEPHNSLATILLKEGKLEEAIAHLRAVTKINPALASAHYNLGNALHRQGQMQEAISEYRTTLNLNPGYIVAHVNLANALLQQGQAEEAINNLEKALNIIPANSTLQNFLAWILATSPDQSLRDGARAIQLATQASRSIGGNTPENLRTLAAAYAETGQFAKAAQVSTNALQLAEKNKNVALTGNLLHEIKLYEAGRRFENAP